jgi:hypothetical protein
MKKLDMEWLSKDYLRDTLENKNNNEKLSLTVGKSTVYLLSRHEMFIVKLEKCIHCICFSFLYF